MMTLRVRVGRGVLGMAVVLAVLPACAIRGLDFRQDRRLTITAPADRSKVRLPVTVSWRVRDFEVTGADGSARPDAGYFGVYVDRAPQPPGETQEWFVGDDDECARDPSCPDEDYLARLNAYATTDTSFRIERLAAPRSDASRRREFHEVTIVFLNGRGERIGESAFTVEFELERDP